MEAAGGFSSRSVFRLVPGDAGGLHGRISLEPHRHRTRLAIGLHGRGGDASGREPPLLSDFSAAQTVAGASSVLDVLCHLRSAAGGFGNADLLVFPSAWLRAGAG